MSIQTTLQGEHGQQTQAAGPSQVRNKIRLKHYNIRTVQELLGHKDVRTTMVYTHVLNRGGKGVRSPLDVMAAVLVR